MTDQSTTCSPDSHPPLFEYVPIEEVERLERYKPGGYHPLVVGDTIKARYQIVHKLGYGTYSTTWLCWDDQSSSYVAVKVGTGDSNPREAEVVSLLNSDSRSSNYPGTAMIPTIQDRFVLRGPNGIHPCYVTTPAMCSISGAKDGSYRRIFQATTARSLSAQLVLALAYVHARGIVHGDLHLGNALLRLPADFDKLSMEQFYTKFGRPSTQPVARLDGEALTPNVPSSATPPIWLGKASEEFSLSDARVFLSDFGEAYSPSTESRYESHAPFSVAPPEARFELKRGLSFSSDVWTLGCAIWAILGQRPLFDDFLATQDDITAEQIDVLGELPPEWRIEWGARHEYFSESGEPRPDRHVRSWDDRFEAHIQRPRRELGIPEFEEGEKVAVTNMLRSMLAFQPEKRATMQDILRCDWMVKWALPEYKRSLL
ncbi:hypothetical protein FQN54_007820 [Arachnomyces sp. PD_36]|nr:hypothetical protein FQN54_007820 [Arachnomyces sp. PD_36]